MCGIVGYTGKQNAADIIFQGLKRLEYRGYDSAGIAVVSRKRIKIEKYVGKLDILGSHLANLPQSTSGIGHTRWATHGKVSQLNAHPHISMNEKVSIVHNGIIDNHKELRCFLSAKGYKYAGETDSELIAHLVEFYLEDSPEQAVRKAVLRLKGTFGLLVMFSDFPDQIIAARQGSPLVLGLGQGEMFVASDPSAFTGRTSQVVYLEDGELAAMKAGDFELRNTADSVIDRQSEEIDINAEELSKGDFRDYLEKEIYEQPDSVWRAMANGGRLAEDFGTAVLGGLNIEKREFFDYKRLVFIGMGTARHSAMIGAHLAERLAGIPARSLDASELRYMNHRVERGTLYFAISQSGETADTIFAVQELKNRGAKVLGIVNNVGSTLARLCDGGIYIHAGVEVSVASTKAFSGQITAVTLLALMLGRMNSVSINQGKEIVNELKQLPDKLKTVLEQADNIERIAEKIKEAGSMLFLGRGISFPIALEGALKVKELSYIHAEGFSAGNMKHGPLALVSGRLPVIFIAPLGDVFEKTLSNMQEVKARGGITIAVSNMGEEVFKGLADYIIPVPEVMEELSPVLTVVPVQMLSLYLARKLDRNVDMPRNLAKSVTVE